MKEFKKTALNPFEKIAGFKALYLGLAAIILTGITGYFANVNFDGVIDMHFLEKELSIASHIIEGFINWLSLSIVLLIAGFIFSKTKFRVIDLFGTQALARWPMLILAILALVTPHKAVTQYLMWKYLGTGEEVAPGTAEIILFILFIIVSIVVIIWTIILMYRAFSISCNIKGTNGVISFIGALILAEIGSKILIDYLYDYVG